MDINAPRTTAANNVGRSITASERSYEILRRVAFARNWTAKAVLEELTESLVAEAKVVRKSALPALSYMIESE